MPHRWILLALLTAGASAAAQEPARLGFFGGLNQAHVDDVPNVSNRVAGAFGAYLAAPVGAERWWTVQVGATYTMKGWARKEPVTGDRSVVKLDYVQVPLLLRHDFATTGRVGVFAFAGPGLAFLARCSISSSDASSGTESSATCAEIESAFPGAIDFKSFEAGAIFGAGLRFAVGRNRLVALGQYEHGLTKVQSDFDNKSRTWTFAAGVELPLGH